MGWKSVDGKELRSKGHSNNRLLQNMEYVKLSFEFYCTFHISTNLWIYDNL